MPIVRSQIFKLVFIALMMLTLVRSAKANVTTEVIKNPDLVQILPGVINGLSVDIVKIGDLPEFAVRAELLESNFTQSEKEKLSEIRRDILSKIVAGLVVGASEVPMVVTEEAILKSTIVVKNLEAAPLDIFKSFRVGVLSKRVEGETAQVAKQRKTLRERAAAVVAFLNESILRSTYRAGKDFVHETKESKGHEFGLSLVFRGELQIGAGKTNIMRTIARGLDVGYDAKSKELVIRTVNRKEKMDGGTAMAFGPKMELRGYRANLDIQEQLSGEGHVHGKSWYPPAPPLLTFASESYPGYHSFGTALAFNVFDVFVPTYLFNTVNEFDADYNVKRISLSPAKLLSKLLAPRPMANSCKSLFSRAH